MRLRSLLVLVLLPFCLGMVQRAPAAGGPAGPARAPSGVQKVFPVALRYRQQFNQHVRLPSPRPPAAARPRPSADALAGRPSEEAPPPPAGAVRLALLQLLLR